MFENSQCSACHQYYKRKFIEVRARQKRIWQSEDGKQMSGNKCYECFKGNNLISAKSLRRKQKLSSTQQALIEMTEGRGRNRKCPHCNEPTANYYACDPCWRVNAKLSMQEWAFFTSEEKKSISKPLEDSNEFNY